MEEIQQKFDDILISLKVLKKGSCSLCLDKELMRDLSQILWISILYMNKQSPHFRVIGVFGDMEEPFVAFDSYKENYDKIFLQEIEQ